MEHKERLNLSQYGLNNIGKIFYNLSYEELFKHETMPNLGEYEKVKLTSSGAVSVDTGMFTGRSPKDKYIVRESGSEDNIWWSGPKGSDNHPIDQKQWDHFLDLSQKQLSNSDLYVVDMFCGANKTTRMKIRFIVEVAWQAHFVTNMFIQPTAEELKSFEPDFVVLNSCKTTNPNWKEQGLNSEVFVAFHLAEKMAVIGGTWYGGEMKKGIFSIMNYYLPIKNIATMHCSANVGNSDDTAVFFGLSGTGKTTLSADPKRYLIGDDEHGWDDDGIFNFEGGCYAKTINLDSKKEPDIFNAIRRNALLENVVIKDDSSVDYNDSSKTENTRVSYPIDHIEKIVKPVSKGASPKRIIFLTADAFGVLPPVAKLSREQAMYHFLSGYTAKVAGTERGITEPTPTFSAAFGAAFLLLHPTKYAKALVDRMDKNQSQAYLVNTGWIGGSYGVGSRIDINSTRAIIDSILDGLIDEAPSEVLMPFQLEIPKELPSVDSNILNPRNLWANKEEYDQKSRLLAEKFISNFTTFTDEEIGKKLVSAGPILD